MPRRPIPREFAQELGERIAECEHVFDTSNSTLAGELGIGSATMSRYRLGKNVPPLSTLVKMAEIAGVNLEWLARGGGGRDCPNGQSLDLDRREVVPVNIVDEKGRFSGDVWGYIMRSWFKPLLSTRNLPAKLPLVGGPSLGCFRIAENLQGQKFLFGTWVLLDCSARTPAPGWFCLTDSSANAFVREIEVDADRTIRVVWPRSGRQPDVLSYSPVIFGAHFSVIGKVVGAALFD